VIELLPALPAAWARPGKATGIGARGGFTVEVTWREGKVSAATVHSVRGGCTTVTAGSWRREITVPPGGRVTVRPAP
jgi:alpha-L-fucosidase 2